MHTMILAILFAANLSLPLAQWGPVRKGVTVEHDAGKLRVAYTIAPGQPAGAATMLKPGTLDGVTALKLRITSTRNAALIVTLMNQKGVAYGSQPIAVRAMTKDYAIDVASLAFVPQQSKGEDPGAYAIGETVMISVIDIAGFMGAEPEDVAWTIESIEGVR
jgi:hypothetical protein